MNDIEALRCLVAEQLPPGGIEQLAAAAAFDRIEADLAAMTARAEAAEAWRADVPWSTLTNIVDAAFHLAKNTHDAELWAECAAVEDWVDAYGIGTNAEHAAQQDKVQR